MRCLNVLGVTLAEGAAQKVFLLFPPTGCDFLLSLPQRKVARLDKTYDKFTNVDRLYRDIQTLSKYLPFVRTIAINVFFVAAHAFSLIEQGIVWTNYGETFA